MATKVSAPARMARIAPGNNRGETMVPPTARPRIGDLLKMFEDASVENGGLALLLRG